MHTSHMISIHFFLVSASACMPDVFKLCSCLPNLGPNPLSCSV